MKYEKKILITIDVEDWFQVENLKAWIPFETWSHRELRVEKNVYRLLDLFDSIKPSSQSDNNSLFLRDKTYRNKGDELNNTLPFTASKETTKKVRATFFVLGWIAQRLPGMIREIHSRGHEVASHGINHQLSNKLNHVLLKEEIYGSKKLLEDVTGAGVCGFRAPSFSINRRILEAAQSAGYQYDSSFNSFSLHGRYGKIDLNGHKTSGIAYKLSRNFYELPVSNLDIFGNPVPWGGGAYFRFIPPVLFRQGIRRILRKYHSYLFYMHPWEIDPDQPRIGKPLSANFIKHYYNLKQTINNLQNLICSFSDCSFTTCRDYISGLP